MTYYLKYHLYRALSTICAVLRAMDREFARIVYQAEDSLYMLAACVVIVLGVVAMGGCADVPRVYVENGVRFHEGDTSPCERGAAACTVNMRDVYYARGDMFALEHERDHLRGMQHGQWAAYGFDVCAKVTVSGATRWHLGALLCRMADGNFYERAM